MAKRKSLDKDRRRRQETIEDEMQREAEKAVQADIAAANSDMEAAAEEFGARNPADAVAQPEGEDRTFDDTSVDVADEVKATDVDQALELANTQDVEIADDTDAAVDHEDLGEELAETDHDQGAADSQGDVDDQTEQFVDDGVTDAQNAAEPVWRSWPAPTVPRRSGIDEAEAFFRFTQRFGGEPQIDGDPRVDDQERARSEKGREAGSDADRHDELADSLDEDEQLTDEFTDEFTDELDQRAGEEEDEEAEGPRDEEKAPKNER